MANSPRTREFYRPILEDLHEAARDWRTSLSRLLPLEIVLTAGVLLAGLILSVGLVGYAVSRTPAVQTPVRPATTSNGLSSLAARGARFGRDSNGNITQATLSGPKFTDRDLRDLSTIDTLESVTVIDANVTDEGLMALRRLSLKHLELVNTQVTDEAVEAFRQAMGPADVSVRLIRGSDAEGDD